MEFDTIHRKSTGETLQEESYRRRSLYKEKEELYRKNSTGEESYEEVLQKYRTYLGDIRSVIYETEDNSMKLIQNAALYVLALNCGIIAYWFGQYKPIFNDFLTHHGAKNENGERNGQPRAQINLFGLDKNIRLNRFIILVSFLSKICIPFIDSITGK